MRAALAKRLASACHDIAARFERGGRLLAFGVGASAADAQHIAVEFVHPVIVGKRALPALSLADDGTVLDTAGRDLDDVFASQIRTLGRPSDIAVGISSEGPVPSVTRALTAAAEAGLLTVALVAGDSGATNDIAVDHRLGVSTGDRLEARALQVSLYHVMWEEVHVFLDQPGLGQEHTTARRDRNRKADGVEALYPFLYEGFTDLEQLLDDVARATEQKMEEIATLRTRLAEDLRGELIAGAEALAQAFRSGGTLLTFGNGGSSTDARALAQMFMDAEGFPLPALALTDDVAALTALANDVGFDVVFARRLRALGGPGDIAVGISTSGGSPNVLAGLEEAARMGMTTVGFAGYGGGEMAALASLDHLYAVPSSSVHRIQEAETTLYQALWKQTHDALGRRPAG